MRKSTRSILQELNDISLGRSPELVIESRASNIIQSAINLLDMIKEEYDIENQRQILESLTTLQNQLNFSFQQDLKNEQDAFNYFLS